jgi:hypothetical protein
MTAPATKRKTASSSPPSGKHDPAQAHRQAYEHRKARAKAKSETLRQKGAAQVEALPVRHPHAAGIDIGSRSHWVCVGFGAEVDPRLIQEFPAHTAGLKGIVAFLREHQVNTVALESTGIYWVPLYELLCAEGFEVLLVDPSYSHQLRGRPKTDRREGAGQQRGQVREWHGRLRGTRSRQRESSCPGGRPPAIRCPVDAPPAGGKIESAAF